MDRDNRFRILSVAVVALAVMAGVLVSARLTRGKGAADAHPGASSGPLSRTGGLYGPSRPDAAPQYEDGCAPDPKAPARLKFELEGGLLDLGLVKQGETIERTVGVRNVGTGTLCVSFVETGCGCVKADWPGSKRIEPGASGAVVVRIDTTGKDGVVEKPVRVYSNDLEHKVSEFTVKLEVRLGILVVASAGQVGGVVYFGRHAVGRPATTNVRLKSPKDGPEWTVTAVEGTRTPFTFELKPVEPADPVFRQVDLVLTHPGSRVANQYDEDLRIKTTHPERPEILLHSQLQVVAKYLTSPSGPVSFGFVRQSMPMPSRQVLVLSGEAKTDFALDGVTVDGQGFVVVGEPRKVPEGWSVEVRYDGRAREAGSTVEATLVVRLKDDDLKELRVTLRATIGS